MSIFKKLFGALLGGGKTPDSAGGNAFWIHVQCNRCGEKIRVRVNREHDLSAEYDGSDQVSSYFTHKEIIGQNCFNRIQVDLTFDSRRRLTEQQIQGGTFIAAEEYEQAPEPATS